MNFYPNLFSKLLNIAIPASLILAASHGHAGLSAHRPLSLPAGQIISAVTSSPGYGFPDSPRSADRAIERRSSFQRADWSRVPEVPVDHVQPSFERVRDEKAHVDEENRNRRATWLYPDDGCFVRATVAADVLKRTEGISTAKIFAFGDLQVSTANSPTGEVGWWYHVAAISKTFDAKTGKTDYHVYDPAMNFERPLAVGEWLSLMGDPDAQISICSGESYDPDSDCANGSSGSLNRGLAEAAWFLPAEWSRLEALNRDPVKELGDEPPWLAHP